MSRPLVLEDFGARPADRSASPQVAGPEPAALEEERLKAFEKGLLEYMRTTGKAVRDELAQHALPEGPVEANPRPTVRNALAAPQSARDVRGTARGQRGRTDRRARRTGRAGDRAEPA